MNFPRNKNFSTGFVGALLLGGCIALGAVLWNQIHVEDATVKYVYPETKFGNYLAIKHAIWADDFQAVIKFSEALKDSDVSTVKIDAAIGRFLAGSFDDSAKVLAEEKSLPARVAYTAYLLRQDDWRGIYKISIKDNSQILSPLRIWSAVAIGKESEALKFIDQLNTSESWKLFVRGMVYAETNRPDKAKEFFDKVPLDFFNLNDYLYLIAFYEKNGFDSAAIDLREEFSATPGGSFAGEYKANAADFIGVKKALSFGLIQNVSHTPAMSYSGAALVLLRLAQAADQGENDAINYYLGMMFFVSDSANYPQYFAKVRSTSPYYPLIMMKNAEKAGNFNKMRRGLEGVLKENPTFMPALTKLVAINLQKDQSKDALKIVNNALGRPEVSEKTQSYLLRLRARIYIARGDLDNAEDDLLKAGDLVPENPEVLSDMAKIWAAKKENLDRAYLYATAVIKDAPSDLDGWDTLAMVVWAKEDASAAAEILERVGRVADENSLLFQHLGDVRAVLGDSRGAIEAYERALKLSGDGLSCSEKCLENKIKRLK